MKVNIVDLSNSPVGSIELDDAVFGVEVREHLFWEVINWQRAKRRAGTHKVKGRSEVSGGGKKPFRQKGTSRARQGSTRASQWVGGGKVHGPQPRDYSYRMPKKKRKEALRAALSQKINKQTLYIVDSLQVEAASTSKFAKLIDAQGAFSTRKALFVDVTTHQVDDVTGKPVSKPEHNEGLRRSVRNIKNAKYLATEGLNVEDLLAHEALIISREAVEKVQEALKP